jgi:hypothetical protein
MIAQERARVEERLGFGLGSALDDARLRGLASIYVVEDLSDELRSSWKRIVTSLLSTPEGRSFFTIGVLRDIAVSVALGGRGKDLELQRLGRAVADKLLHQLRGPKARADDLLASLEQLPNRDEIAALLDRMKSGPGNELLTLL